MSIISQTSLPSSSPDLVLFNQVSDASVITGDWVRLDNLGVLVKAFADDVDNANVFGLVESKNSPISANVRVGGVSEPVFLGLDVTKEYFLSDVLAGTMTKQGVNIPSDPNHVVIKLGQPVDATRFLVDRGLRFVRS